MLKQRFSNVTVVPKGNAPPLSDVTLAFIFQRDAKLAGTCTNMLPSAAEVGWGQGPDTETKC
jgi:hypothetical protein